MARPNRSISFVTVSRRGGETPSSSVIRDAVKRPFL